MTERTQKSATTSRRKKSPLVRAHLRRLVAAQSEAAKLPAGFRQSTLTVIGHVKRGGRLDCLVRCDCGAEKIIQKGRVLTAKSCGCKTKEILRKARTIHGQAVLKTPTYRAWRGMRQRCTLQCRRDYPDYGGRGITVCERWKSFENFLADMGEKPPGAQLDRYPDNDGNYEPGNCRWATPRQNANNRRSSRFVELRGKRKTLVEWARVVGIPPDTLSFRLDNGWSVDAALTRPVKRQKNNRAAYSLVEGRHARAA